MNRLKALLNQLFNRRPAPASPEVEAQLQTLIDCLATTEEDEADCAEFDSRMDCLAEMLVDGRLRGEVLTPEIEAHLRHSADCREEFDALIAILKAEEAGQLETLSE